jgi:hypothetical protein
LQGSADNKKKQKDASMEQKDVDMVQKIVNVKQKGLALAAKVSRSSAMHSARIKRKEQQHADMETQTMQTACKHDTKHVFIGCLAGRGPNPAPARGGRPLCYPLRVSCELLPLGLWPA